MIEVYQISYSQDYCLQIKNFSIFMVWLNILQSISILP